MTTRLVKLFELLEKAAAVGCEEEGDAVVVPAGGGLRVASGVAFGLLEAGGNVFVFAFGFDDGDGDQAKEEDVVGGAAGGGPLGDGGALLTSFGGGRLWRR